MRQEQKQEQEQQQKVERKYKIAIHIIYKVTHPGRALETRTHYQRDINRFLAYFKITNIEPLRTLALQQCKDMIIKYIVHLREHLRLSRKSIMLHKSAIRYFFVMIRDDEFPIKWDKINLELPAPKFTHRDRGYTVEEIQKLLELGCQGRLREKAVILLLTTAGGMRIGGIPTLKLGDLKVMQTSNGEKVYGIRVYPDSLEDYFTPYSPECTIALDRYLEERAQSKEVLGYDSIADYVHV